MPLVVLDQRFGLILARPREPKAHIDSLEDGGIAPLTDGLEVDLEAIQSHLGITRTALHHQDTAGRDAG